jgi:hypothetical protein
MTRRLCIVSRESSAVLGYLMVALRREPSGSDDLEFVVDRRHAQARPAYPSTERRHGRGTDSVLTTHGYAIVEAEEVEPEVSEAPAISGRSARPGPAPGRAGSLRPGRQPEPEPDYVELEPLESPDGARWRPSRRSLALGALCGLGAVALAASLVWQMMGGFSAPPRIVTPAPPPEVAVTRAPDPAPVPATPPVPAPPVAMPRAVEPPAAPPAERPAPAPTVKPPVASPPRPSPSPPAAASRAPAQKRGLAEPPRAAVAPPRSPASSRLPRGELASKPNGTGAARTITYTAKLRDPDNQPLVGANVTVHGTMRKGSSPLLTRLEPTGTPGVYRGRAAVGRQTPADVRVKVLVSGTRVEVPLDR